MKLNLVDQQDVGAIADHSWGDESSAKILINENTLNNTIMQ